ncbi:MAG: MBL fold metallo-hydrolase [Emcibacter sp.]|nr:MBL fold metallo-hydrolase [Emcibacter sp.]
MKLKFLGATETVTGSKYLLEEEKTKILIDCGLFQGKKELRLRNWAKLPLDIGSLEAVVLTHAHIDHSGYLPLLVRLGFRGKIYCSRATYDLCSILLPDSGYLQEEDARRANKYGYTKHAKAEPLYSQKDARNALKYFHPMPFDEFFTIGNIFKIKFQRSGHILGSSFVSINNGHKTIVFSGDIGRPNNPIMVEPIHIESADYLVVESTYGDRLHDRGDPTERLGNIITSTASKGGTVIIPAFAVGRAQSVLYYIHLLKQQGKIPDIPVYMDSPMASAATSLLNKHNSEHRLSEKECRDACRTAIYTKTAEESKELDSAHAMPSVIISASGMATGGRILHHLKTYMGDDKNTILFTGFQAQGTRGDRIIRGEKEIKIHGQMWPVRARIENLTTMSAHADYEELLEWLSYFKQPPIKTFITHGEEEASVALKSKIEEKFGWDVSIPKYLQIEEL